MTYEVNWGIFIILLFVYFILIYRILLPYNLYLRSDFMGVYQAKKKVKLEPQLVRTSNSVLGINFDQSRSTTEKLFNMDVITLTDRSYDNYSSASGIFSFITAGDYKGSILANDDTPKEYRLTFNVVVTASEKTPRPTSKAESIINVVGVRGRQLKTLATLKFKAGVFAAIGSEANKFTINYIYVEPGEIIFVTLMQNDCFILLDEIQLEITPIVTVQSINMVES